MKQCVSIIGGDLRIVKLAELLVKDKYEIKTYALEKAEELKDIIQIKECVTLQEAIEKSDFAIGPIPLSKNQLEIMSPFSEKKVTLENLAKALKGKKFIARKHQTGIL